VNEANREMAVIPACAIHRCHNLTRVNTTWLATTAAQIHGGHGRRKPQTHYLQPKSLLVRVRVIRRMCLTT